MERLPNAIVIGAPRSGTTSVYEYLGAHPDVYMSPVKEPDFFSYPSLDAVHLREASATPSIEEDTRRATALQGDLKRYMALFQDVGDATIRGEASAIYLGHPTAAQHIRRYVPDAKLIAILRDPSERMFSHFVHAKRIYAESALSPRRARDDVRSVEKAFIEVVDRAHRDGFSREARTDPEVWLRSGFYFQHLSRFRSLFPSEQLRVFLFEDLLSDTNALMADIYRFLEVDDSFTLPTTEAFNASVVPRNQRLFRLFTTQIPLMRYARSVSPTFVRAAAMRTRNRLLARGKPPLDQEVRRKLVGVYRDDVLQLQDLLGRDLSGWLDEKGAR